MAGEPKRLEESTILYAAGAVQSFPDTVMDRFTGTLVVAAGASVSDSGLINGCKQLFLTLPQLVFGHASDVVGKRRLIVAGRMANGSSLILLAIIDLPAFLLPLVIGVNISIAICTPAWGSLLGDYASGVRRGTILGRINSVASLGGLVAMLVALALSIGQVGQMTKTSFIPLLWVSAALSFASIPLVALTDELREEAPESKLDFRALTQDMRLWRLLLLSFVFGIGAATATPFFGFITVQKLQMTVWQVALTATANLTCNSLTQRPAGRLMDRIGRRPILIFSRVVMAASPIGYALATSWLHIVAIEALVGVALASWNSGQATYVLDIAPRGLRATYLAAGVAATGVSNFLGSTISGAMTQPYVAATGFAGIGVALILAGVLRLGLGFAFLTLPETGKAHK
jgi:MFS family permease